MISKIDLEERARKDFKKLFTDNRWAMQAQAVVQQQPQQSATTPRRVFKVERRTK